MSWDAGAETLMHALRITKGQAYSDPGVTRHHLCLSPQSGGSDEPSGAAICCLHGKMPPPRVPGKTNKEIAAGLRLVTKPSNYLANVCSNSISPGGPGRPFYLKKRSLRDRLTL